MLLAGFSFCCQAQPVVTAIADAASFNARVSPGVVATLFGYALTPSTAFASSVPLPAQLGGVSITVDGYPAPLLYTNQYQINFIVPYEVAVGPQILSLSSASGDTSVTIYVDPASPGIFQVANQAIAENYSTGDLNGPVLP